ncbi:MAG: hypothetical protein WCJ96_08100 [Verrucomicrobiota bacterium]|jgi:hypothetical protein
MLRRIAGLFRKPVYRESTYAHPDLSGQTKLPWRTKMRLMLSARHGLDHADETPNLWVRHRRWLLIVFALVVAWVLAESAVAWNFFEG